MTPPAPLEPLMNAVEELRALDRPAKLLGAVARRGFGSGAFKDAISGTWLGNSVHAPLTDAVIGPLLSASLLDVLSPESPRAAQRLIEAGLAIAVPTALAGLNDWADSEATDSGVRRAGVLHGVGNLSALGLYAGSLAARRRGAERRGRRLAAAGLAAITAGSYLGGHMSFRRGVAVNQTAHDRGPVDWTAVAPAAAPAGERPLRVLAGDTPVLLVRDGDSIHAIHDRCSHRGCSLASGRVDGHVVSCRCHGSRFDLRDGTVIAGPAGYAQPVFEVRGPADRLEVRLRRPT